MQARLKQIVIAGGGSAGLDDRRCACRVCSIRRTSRSRSSNPMRSARSEWVKRPSPTSSTSIACSASMKPEFMKATNATFKLGIEFIDWGRKGDRYIHPFSVHGVDMKGIDFHNYWLHERAGGGPHPIQQYSLCAVAASQGKFTLPDPNPRSLLTHIRYAYHFDAIALRALPAHVRGGARSAARRRQDPARSAGAGNRQHRGVAARRWPGGAAAISFSIAPDSGRSSWEQSWACRSSTGATGCPAIRRWRCHAAMRDPCCPTRGRRPGPPAGSGASRRSSARATATSIAANS